MEGTADACAGDRAGLEAVGFVVEHAAAINSRSGTVHVKKRASTMNFVSTRFRYGYLTTRVTRAGLRRS